jgi:predicted kinase
VNHKKPVLYLFIGYPGAGKTTIAKIITELTGAHHIWADHERNKLFKQPTHSEQESQDLYEKLNNAADYLLSQGKNVVFDTNFNFLSDREKLREIAEKNDARTIVIWVTTPIDVAKSRALTDEPRNEYEFSMTDEQFDSITSKLEEPQEGEQVIKVDGTDLDKDSLLRELGIKP